MNFKVISLLAIVLLLMSGCKEETGSLRLNFVGNYGNDPLVLGEELAYYPDYGIRMLESDFFISEVALTKGSDVMTVAEIDFVNFTDNNFNLENAIAGINLDYDNIEAGTYDGIRFGIGVPGDKNMTLPRDYPSSSPLSNTSYHWEAWDSFIFAKYAGQVEGQGFFFHTGTDPLYRTVTLDTEIVITGSNTSTVKINLDHKKLMNENGQLYDIKAVPANHNPLTIGPLENFVNNYSTAFTLDN